MKIFRGCACPQCGSGVMEAIGYFELKPGPIELDISFELPEDKPAIQILICSLDQCAFVQMEAAPGSLSHAKHELKNAIFGSCRI